MCKCFRLHDAERSATITPPHMPKIKQIRGEHVEQTASVMKRDAGEKPNVIRTSGSRGGQKIKLADNTKNSKLELPTHRVSFLSM